MDDETEQVIDNETTVGLKKSTKTSETSQSTDENTVAWYETLPEELKDSPSIQKHKSVDSLAKAYIEASKKLGMKGVTPLPPDATREQREAYNAMRRGDTIKAPEDYSFEKGNEDAQLKMLKCALFKAGADDYMAKEVLSSLNAEQDALEAELIANTERVYSKESERLRTEWGENYLINLKANDILLSKYPEAELVLKATGADKCYGVQMMLSKLNALSQDGQIKLEAAREKSYDEQIKSISNSDAYKQAWHPEHNKALQERAELIVRKVRSQG